ncbi:hypothetical protein [Rubinisphaera italica]|uniref:Uncharacterized protein n=1 Tax=Rubinisphaera italica TaxID=2527969 RepID=A0A5C5XJI1_9PLAN|nr:hypothetical protein [Rubinisphaera italica]TWT62984.1 hypothetical protein Pan54_37350 [Rubinisphaera italica]
MILRIGITGFRERLDPPLSLSDIAKFKTSCFEFARKTGARVNSENLKAPNETSNFRTAHFETPNQKFSALVNLHFPVIGFVSRTGGFNSSNLQFIDCLWETTEFEDFEILSQSDLQKEISKEELEQLSPAERIQVKYWKPKRIGDVIFNCWD